MSSAVIFQIQSILIYCLMIWGIKNRRNRNLHVKIMGSTIFWDVLLILQIELSRSAVAKAAKAVVNPMLLNIHVSFALSCVVCYVILIYSGRKLLKGESTFRKRHKIFGWSAFVLRTLTLLTSFFAVSTN